MEIIYEVIYILYFIVLLAIIIAIVAGAIYALMWTYQNGLSGVYDILVKIATAAWEGAG